MAKEIRYLQGLLSERDNQIFNFKRQAHEFASVGPLKQHLEHLEFLIQERSEEIASLKLNQGELKDSLKEKSESFEMLELEYNHLEQIKESIYSMNVSL